MRKKPTEITQSDERTEPIVNALHPDYVPPKKEPTLPLSKVKELLREFVQDMESERAKWIGRKGGHTEKKVKELIPVVEKAKEANHKKTAKEVWRYLEDTLPHFQIDVDGTEGPYFLNNRLIWSYSDTSTRSIGYDAFRLNYFPKKSNLKKDK